MLKDKLKGLSKFPKVFWVVQTFEMMERGAYYSMTPILVIHAIYNLGLPEWLGGMLFAFMYTFQYGLPIFTGALAEKIGYKRQIIFAFIFLTFAYICLSLAFNTFTMILAVMAIGMGIGSYKPLVSSTIAKCTSAEDRNLAYSIYYWVVNFAATVFPIVFVILELTGHLPRSSYNFVFLAGGLMVSVNIITSILIFKEVPRSGQVKTVRDAINNIKLAMSDKKFVVMVILIGGFWAQYSTMLFAIQIIGFGYHWFPSFITPMVLGIPNPLTIILLGPVISKLVEKIESMRVVLGGLLIYIVGLVIIGFSLQNWALIIIGIVIGSIGEFMVAPGCLAFISKLAPKEKISAYMGCNFISYLIGLLGGTIVFAFLVAYIGVDLLRPHFFYGILISFALLLMFAFIIYYKTWGQDVIERAKEIKRLEEGVGLAPGIPSDYKEPFMFRIFENRLTSIVPLFLVPIVLFGSFSFGTFHYYGPEEEEEGVTPFNPEDYNVVTRDLLSKSGTLNEGEYITFTETIGIGEGQYLAEGELLKSIEVELTWEDGVYQPAALVWDNLPDEFEMKVSEGTNYTDERSASNPQNGQGTITISFEFNPDSIKSVNGTGEWIIDVTLVACGDYEHPFLPLTNPDGSNDYAMVARTEVYTPKGP